MRAYSESYLEQIVETQGQLFDFVSYKFPECDTKDFIDKYMQSYTRQRIDKADAYLANEDVEDLYAWFIKLDNYSFSPVTSSQENSSAIESNSKSIEEANSKSVKDTGSEVKVYDFSKLLEN